MADTQNSNTTNKGLFFTLSLKDLMSKSIKTIKDNYDKLKNAVKEVNKETKDETEKMSKLGKEMKSLTAIKSAYFKSVNSDFSKAKKSFDGITGSFKNLTKESSHLLSSLNEVQKQTDLMGFGLSNLQDASIELSSELRSSIHDITEIFKSTNQIQFQSKENLVRFTKAVKLLSETTDLSTSSASRALDTYQFWYKGSSDGFLRLANTIRFVAATSRLSADEVSGVLDKFQNAALNLDKSVRQNVVNSSLAISKAAGNAGVDLGELSGMFEALTDKYSEQGIILKSFIQQQTKVSLQELDKLIAEGDFTKIFTLFRESIDETRLSQKTLMIWKDSFKDITGSSFEMARALREIPLSQFNKDIKDTLAASKSTEKITNDFEKFRMTLDGLIGEIKSSFEPVLASLQKHFLQAGITVLSGFRDTIVGMNKVFSKTSIYLNSFLALIDKNDSIKLFLKNTGLILAGILAFSVSKTAIVLALGAIRLAFGSLLTVMLPLIAKAAAIYGAWLLIQKGLATFLGMEEEAIDFSFIMKSVFEGIANAVDFLKESFVYLFELSGGMKAWGERVSFIADVARESFKNFKDIILEIIDIIPKMVKSATEGASKLSETLKLDKVFEKTGLGSLTQTIGEYAGFSEGGVVTKPTLAMVGEGGEPEVILPFSKISRFVESLAEKNRPISLTEFQRNPVKFGTETRVIGSIQAKAPNVMVNVNNQGSELILKDILFELRSNKQRVEVEKENLFGGLNSLKFGLMNGM